MKQDASDCISLRPDWSKSHFRRGGTFCLFCNERVNTQESFACLTCAHILVVKELSSARLFDAGDVYRHLGHWRQAEAHFRFVLDCVVVIKNKQPRSVAQTHTTLMTHLCVSTRVAFSKDPHDTQLRDLVSSTPAKATRTASLRAGVSRVLEEPLTLHRRMRCRMRYVCRYLRPPPRPSCQICRKKYCWGWKSDSV